MGTIYFDLSMSLDGFIAGPNVSAELPLLGSAQRWFANTSVVDSDGVVHLRYRLLRQ